MTPDSPCVDGTARIDPRSKPVNCQESAGTTSVPVRPSILFRFRLTVSRDTFRAKSIDASL
jgi:hypothetical protein